MKLPELKINKVVFVTAKNGTRHAWYLTIVKIGKENSCFWSHHDCSHLSDKQAEKAFESEHYNEVAELVKQKIQNETLIIS